MIICCPNDQQQWKWWHEAERKNQCIDLQLSLILSKNERISAAANDDMLSQRQRPTTAQMKSICAERRGYRQTTIRKAAIDQ